MTVDLNQAREALARCRALRESGAVEAVLRGELQSRLRLIFPQADDEHWINHYSEGAEAHTRVGVAGGAAASRFIDHLVGSTTIEYEADLRIPAKWEQGYRQVKEHVAGLVRSGVPASRVRGILTDAVNWYAYDVLLMPGDTIGEWTVDDIQLIEVDAFEPADDDIATANRLALFLRKHLAREQSRPLIAENLALDLGLESPAYRRSVTTLIELVQAGLEADPSVGLATELWSCFVDHLESDGGPFRIDAYVDAVYLTILARLLSANALRGTALISDDRELRAILDGSFFRDTYHLNNLIEKDYFCWIAEPAYVAKVLPIAREIQRDLYAYDFSRRAEEDLFGRLMAQLARRAQRKLLGQEWTPSWLARHLVQRCLEELPQGELPAVVDMCCGSGAILAEVIKTAKVRYGCADFASLANVATGFDIDPLAVALAKTTWVITLADEIRASPGPVTIPVYHADSLFAVTPVSAALPVLGESGAIDIALDGQTVKLPGGLLQPEYRELFDKLVDWAHDEAQQPGSVPLTEDDARAAVDGAALSSDAGLSEQLRRATEGAVLGLACRMKELTDAGRNGIWAFILRNTYRPGLLTGRFNGLVSNPPWLAMSALANNPYREVLARRAALYGVRPAGASFLHLELATTHLLHAVDRYLKPGAAVACLVPGTILNGHHHENFRQREYLRSDRRVALSVAEVWQVEPGTFKYPCVALIGRKEADVDAADRPVTAGAVVSPDKIEPVDFAIRMIGEARSAWVLEKAGQPAAHSGRRDVFREGADLMPRTAVCIEVLDASGHEYRVDTPGPDSRWAFTVQRAKKLKGEKFPGYVAPRFIHYIAQSENLLPFVLGPHRAPIAIPAYRDTAGKWQVRVPADIRRMGFTETARRFDRVDSALRSIDGTSLASRIDVRGKLSSQCFGAEGFVVLFGAGGTYICAACLPGAEASTLVIDQTLYWQSVPDEDNAWYRTGVLNSSALTQAILPFNPKGNFGPRHIHTLPSRFMPSYDSANESHRAVAAAARIVAGEAAAIVARDDYIGDPCRQLGTRRRKLREQLTASEAFQELERLCAAILGIAPGV